ncbi:unnamed protein product [Polarella glacialis]|uniref:Uncharacterized protein n=1 Tax=Polarella glacialis TaxID=89957 RepID=A0A813LVN4_POLGL|nr:unnamed protein product [Polarella glacialis]
MRSDTTSEQINTITLRLGDLHLTVTSSGTTASAASSSHGAVQASSLAGASSAPAASDVPSSPCSAAGSSPAPESALDPWVSRLAVAAVAAGEFAKQLLDGGRPNRWAKHPADLGGRRNTVHVVLQGRPGLGVGAGYSTTAEGRRLWTGQPCADGAVFHSFPSLRDAQAYFEAAGLAGRLPERSTSSVKAALAAAGLAQQ